MSGFTLPFSGWALPLALTALAGSFRITAVLRYALDLGSYDAVAHLYLTMNNVAASFGEVHCACL